MLNAVLQVVEIANMPYTAVLDLPICETLNLCLYAKDKAKQTEANNKRWKKNH